MKESIIRMDCYSEYNEKFHLEWNVILRELVTEESRPIKKGDPSLRSG